MIKLFGVSVWIHSIFILVLGVLLLFHLAKRDKEAFQDTPATNPGSGSGSGSGSSIPLNPGASGSGAAYDLTNCVPGSTNTLGSGVNIGNYSVETYTIEDCPVLKIQISSLKNMAVTFFQNFQSTSLQDAQAQLCSLNISYLQTGCNESNSIPQSGSQIIANTFGSSITTPITPSSELLPTVLPADIVTGSMTINTQEISISKSATGVINIGSMIYLGDYPISYIGPYYVSNINSSGTILTTTARNNASTLNNVKVYWSPPLGRANVPVKRASSNSIVQVDVYTGYRYILMQDIDGNLPTGIEEGTPVYLSNCLKTTGPYVLAKKPSTDRILLGNYMGQSAITLASDGTFNEASVLGGYMFPSLYAPPIPLTIGVAYNDKCNPGTFLRDRKCFSCPVGHYCPADSTFPLPCPEGTYNPIINLISPNGCTSCPPGKICSSGTDKPIPCPSGYFCQGGTNIYACPPGFVSNTGASNVSMCSMCDAGYYCPNNTLNPLLCNIQPGGAIEKIQCPSGHFCPPGQNAPIPCNAGTYSETVGNTNGFMCKPCPGGYYSSQPRTRECGMCLPGTYCPSGSKTPLVCPQGTYCPDNAMASPISFCAADKYSAGLTTGNTTNKDDCIPYCPAGFQNEPGLKTNQYGYTYCKKPCPPGFYCPYGVINPVPCPDGTYSNSGSSNVSACTSSVCPVGYYCTNGNKTMCPIGTYCLGGRLSTSEASTPTPCVEGADCPAGTQVPNNNYSCEEKRFRLSNEYLINNRVYDIVRSRVCKAPISRPNEIYTYWWDYNVNTNEWTGHNGNLQDRFGASNLIPV